VRSLDTEPFGSVYNERQGHANGFSARLADSFPPYASANRRALHPTCAGGVFSLIKCASNISSNASANTTIDPIAGSSIT